MAKTEDGEFELILGNRQLISVFLIVVILLGVFFSMGYIVGRNSAPPSAIANNGQGGRPNVVEPPSRKETEQASSTQPPASDPTPTTVPDTKAVPPSGPPVAEKTPPEKREPVTPPAPPPQKKTEPPPPAPERAPEVSGDRPAPGIYWQVGASPRASAEVVAGALRNKGMHVVLVQAPDKNLFRVLVGPYPDSSAAAVARTQLEATGSKEMIQRKF